MICRLDSCMPPTLSSLIHKLCAFIWPTLLSLFCSLERDLCLYRAQSVKSAKSILWSVWNNFKIELFFVFQQITLSHWQRKKSTKICKQIWSFKILFFCLLSSSCQNNQSVQATEVVFSSPKLASEATDVWHHLKTFQKQKQLGDLVFKFKIFEAMFFVGFVWIALCWRQNFPCIKVETAYLSGEGSLCFKYKWINKLTSEECFPVFVEKLSFLKDCERWCY